MEEPSPDDLAALALTERELFSLYAQYPEIDFDPESTQKMSESSEHFSSPASNTGDGDELASVQASNSTRHTTPLKYDMLNTESSAADEYTMFCTYLRSCDLPPQTVQYLGNIGACFAQLGRYIIAEDGVHSDSVTGMTSSLLPHLQHSTYEVKEQIETVKYVADLTPFNISPTDISLWSNYRQRASLISQHLSCPTQTELKLLDQLLLVVDAYVYSPYLHIKLREHTSLDANIEDAINALYDAMQSLLGIYQRWCRAMRNFKIKYMTPIMRRIQDSPWIQREIEQMESLHEAARETLSKDGSSVADMDLQGEQIEQAAKLAARRAKSSGSKVPTRMKTRFKREHTV